MMKYKEIPELNGMGEMNGNAQPVKSLSLLIPMQTGEDDAGQDDKYHTEDR